MWSPHGFVFENMAASFKKMRSCVYHRYAILLIAQAAMIMSL